MKIPAVWEKTLVPRFFKYLERYICSHNNASWFSCMSSNLPVDWIYYFGLWIWKSLLFFSREETKNQSIHRNTGLSNVWTNNKLNPYNTRATQMGEECCPHCIIPAHLMLQNHASHSQKVFWPYVYNTPPTPLANNI